MIRLIMIGAGGHALSVADSLDRTAVELVGCINEVNDLTLRRSARGASSGNTRW